MNVVGLTTSHEVYIASKERKFRINELIIIDDPNQGPVIGEVSETFSYNRYIPFSLNHDFFDAKVVESLKRLGYSIDEEEINVAKVKLMTETTYPIVTGSKARIPDFFEVKDILVRGSKEDGLVLGEIKHTEETAQTMGEELKGLFYILNKGKTEKTKSVPFILDLRSFQQYPHIGIFGGSGSGKSFGMRVIMEELMRKRIPSIILDPHYEMDFSTSSDLGERPDFSDCYQKFQIGEEIGVEFSALTTRDLLDLLSAVKPLTEAMSSAVEILFKRGDTYASFSSRVEDLCEALEMGKAKLDKMLALEGIKEIEKEKYRRLRELMEEYSNIPLPSVQGISWRLRRLYYSGIFSHDINPVIRALKSGKLSVIQGPIWLLQVFATYILSSLYRKRRDYKDGELKGEKNFEYFPPFVVATDEAHNFAPKGYDAPSKGIIKEIAQEGRKYGVFLVLATQRPTLLDETVTAQLNTKIIFRTVRGNDISTLMEETDLSSEEAKRLPYLPSGDAFVSTPLFGRTIAIRVRYPYSMSPHLKNPFDELIEKSNQEMEEYYELIKKELPIYESNLLRVAKNISSQNLKVVMEVNALKNLLEEMVKKGKIKKEESPFGSFYTEA